MGATRMKSELYHCFKIIRLSFLGLCIVFFAQAGWAYTSEDCVRCHQEGSSESKLHISVSDFKSSIHGKTITCAECHTGVVDEKHRTDRTLGAVDCTQCHEQKNHHGMGSAALNRPQCYSCHTRHNILPKDNAASSVYPTALRTTCAACHPRECGRMDYLTWLPAWQISSHKKQYFGQAYDRTDCLGCHQGHAAHGEEGQIDGQQCYKCHMPSKDGGAPMMGYIHPIADISKQPAIFASAVIYQCIVVVLLIGGIGFYIRRFSRKNDDAERR